MMQRMLWRARLPILGTVLLSLGLAGCGEPVQFMERPSDPSSSGLLAAQSRPLQQSVASVFYVAAPVSNDRMRAALDDVFPERVLRVSQRVRRAACIERNGRKRCNSADVKGDVRLEGAVSVEAHNGEIAIRLPLRFNLGMQGRGRTRELQRTETGLYTLTLLYAVKLNKNGDVNVDGGNNWTWDRAPKLEVFEKSLDLSKSIPRNLSKARRSVRSRLAKLLDTGVEPELLEEAWRSAFYPLAVAELSASAASQDTGPEDGATADTSAADGDTTVDVAQDEASDALSQTPSMGNWMRGDPQALHFIGLGGAGDGLSVRYAIPSKITTFVDERPVPGLPVQMPELARTPPPVSQSELLVPVRISYDILQAQLERVVPPGTELTGTGANPATFTVEALKVFAADGLITLAFDLDGPATGRAYAVAKPRISDDGKTLDMSDIALTRGMPNPSLYTDGRFLLADLPLAEAFADGLSYAPADTLGDIAQRANAAVSQRFSAGLEMTTRFDDWRIAHVQPTPEALLLFLALSGDIVLQAAASGGGIAVETATTADPN